MPAPTSRRCAQHVTRRSPRPGMLMPRHSETRTLPYSPEQMFNLVADVESYPQFLPWISAIRVRQNSETEMLADMIVGFKGLRETFTSRVVKERPLSVHVDYVDGPLKH